jgi:hypothetical protein
MLNNTGWNFLMKEKVNVDEIEFVRKVDSSDRSLAPIQG